MKSASSLSDSIFTMLIAVGMLWCIKSLEFIAQIDLSGLGIQPQSQLGLLGIFTGPIVHGSFDHLMANTAPMLILGSMLFYGYPKAGWRVVACIWIISGLGVWLFGRPSTHLGASGLTHGVFFFLLVASLFRRDKTALAIMMISFFLYGGMIASIFPSQPEVSFEYHLFGAIAGIIAAVRWHRLDPSPEEKKYEWEGEDESNVEALKDELAQRRLSQRSDDIEIDNR